jgi:hypothetical protein
MNRSYSKIRHIKKSNILLENRLLNEDEVLDQIFSKITKSGFDSLDYYEKNVLNKYKKFVEKNNNSDRFVSPERGKEDISPFEYLRPSGKYSDEELEGEPVLSIHDKPKSRCASGNCGKNANDFESTKDKDFYDNIYIGTFDGKFFVNQNDVPVEFTPTKYKEIECYETIEEFSKDFPVWCYKLFKFFDARLFKDIEGSVKSSDYPDWWWKLQDFGQTVSPFREDNIEKEKVLQNAKKVFSRYLTSSPSSCFKVYKNKLL